MTYKPEAPGGDSQGLDSDSTRRGQADFSLPHAGDDKDLVVPFHRPWSCRPDAADVERRFRLDVAGWRSRILCARRLSHDAADPVAPYHDGRWTT
jgi:hypothetical protein